jgi:hypothetical protein
MQRGRRNAQKFSATITSRVILNSKAHKPIEYLLWLQIIDFSIEGAPIHARMYKYTQRRRTKRRRHVSALFIIAAYHYKLAGVLSQ